MVAKFSNLISVFSDEAMSLVPEYLGHNAYQLEEEIFSNSYSKDVYLNFMARLVIELQSLG